MLDASGLDSLERMFDTNVVGLLKVSRAFAPVLARNGGGAFVNMLSIASWASNPLLANYAVSKSAAWSATNGLREAVRHQGTQVLGVHVGFIDTDLTRGFDTPKLAPATVVVSLFAALEAGDSEVLVDEITRQVKRGLSADTGHFSPRRLRQRRGPRTHTGPSAPAAPSRTASTREGTRVTPFPLVSYQGERLCWRGIGGGAQLLKRPGFTLDATLSARMETLDPEQPSQRLATDFALSELDDIAVIANRHLDRVERFIERERSLLDQASHEFLTPIAVIAGSMPWRRTWSRTMSTCSLGRRRASSSWSWRRCGSIVRRRSRGSWWGTCCATQPRTASRAISSLAWPAGV